VEYEVENPIMTWPQIQESVKEAEETHNRTLAEKNERHRSCYDIMGAGLCTHQTPVPANQPKMTLEQFKAKSRVRYIQTKKKCHAQLQRTWQDRHSRQLSCGEKVKVAWTTSPLNYTQVAFKGEKFNTDKQEQIKEKRKLNEAENENKKKLKTEEEKLE
jgi:hypothetical protein